MLVGEGTNDTIAKSKVYLFLGSASGLKSAGYLATDTNQTIYGLMMTKPCVVDWNEDGKKDLLLGERFNVPPNSGNLRLYLNGGTNMAPKFSTYSMVLCNNQQIYGISCSPTIGDLNKDGKKDLLVGVKDGNLSQYFYFYQNTGTNVSPIFNSDVPLRNTNGELLGIDTAMDTIYSAAIQLVDIDNDGDLDLVSGHYQGFVEYFENADSSSVVSINKTFADKNSSKHFTVIGITKGKVSVGYSTEKIVPIEVAIYSVDGRLIQSSIHLNKESENGQLHFSMVNKKGSLLPAGTYFLKFKAGIYQQCERIVLL